MCVIILMGIAGCGKSTLGRLLSDRLNVPFIEGDDYHPRANIEKMSRGEPLTDADRMPWIDALVRVVNAQTNALSVLACSALTEAVRLRLTGGLTKTHHFVHLTGTRETIRERLRNRSGHFFDPALLDSQIAALEAPHDAFVIENTGSPDAVCSAIEHYLRQQSVIA